MNVHPVDLAIVGIYLLVTLVLGALLSRRAAEGVESYFLGGRQIPWYLLGVANASGMFDVSGTMWLATILLVYGLQSIWLPWMWPTFNQVFLMVYLSVWIRRSRAMTGADWLATRFGQGLGLELSHLSVVFFALVGVVGFQAYAFYGIGKFAAIFLPFEWSPATYAAVIMAITGAYTILGGMHSVVVTDVLQYILMTIVSFWVAGIALARTTGDQLRDLVPHGWGNLFSGFRGNLDWSQLAPALQERIGRDGFALFTVVFVLMLLKGIPASMAGPAPNYDLQRVLATRRPRESAYLSAVVSPILFVPRYFLVAGIVVLGLVFLGTELRGMRADVDFEQVLPLVIRKFLPVGVTGLTLAGLLAAFMSTYSSTVNAGSAYLVNDFYKRYCVPNLSPRHHLAASYGASLLMVIASIVAGWQITSHQSDTTLASTEAVESGESSAVAPAEANAGPPHVSVSLNDVVVWITAGLYGGYIAPNLLKWHWWRLNGIGFFSGMMAGTIPAMLLATRAPWLRNVLPGWAAENPLFAFPFLFALSLASSIAGSLWTKPDDPGVLKQFYRQVRPWGWWRPVHDACLADGLSLAPNQDAVRDIFNCGVGMIWQVALAAAPVLLVIREYRSFWISVALVVVTSAILKVTWYDGIQDWPEQAIVEGSSTGNE